MTTLPVANETQTLAVLEQIDDTTGAFTQEAFTRALETAPYLGEIAVQIDNDRTPHFTPNSNGLQASRLALNADPEFYRAAIRSGLVSKRMGEFSEFYRGHGVTPRIPELVTAVSLHELGHGEDFQRYINKAGGSTQAAFAMSRDVRKSQIATLPLGASTSRAQKAWDNNTEGYRDKLRAMGWTDEMWEAQKLRNTEEYTKLSVEKVADRFALGVLATIYPR